MALELVYNYDEATADMDIFNENDIEELRQWINTSNDTKDVPKNLNNKQLVLFYNSCYSDIEKTKKCIVNYYNCRKNSPKIFNNRTFSDEDKNTLEVIRLCVLPGKSVGGEDIIYYSIYEDDYTKFNLESACKMIFMTVDLYLSTRGPQPGYMFVIDACGVRFMHLTRISIAVFRKGIQYLQTAMPVRLRSIHMLNANPVIDKVLSLMRPFMDKKFIDMMHFHKNGEDFDLLYKVIPKSSLPSNFGGDHPDLNTLHEDNTRQLQLLEPYFKAEEEQRMKALNDAN